MNHLNHTIDEFIDVANKQEYKGIKKYGKPLDPLDDYNWLDMEFEELVDATKYNRAQKEKIRFIVSKIRKLLDYKDNSVSKVEIEYWLEVLEGRTNTTLEK